jgi:hypothetical protein
MAPPKGGVGGPSLSYKDSLNSTSGKNNEPMQPNDPPLQKQEQPGTAQPPQKFAPDATKTNTCIVKSDERP